MARDHGRHWSLGMVGLLSSWACAMDATSVERDDRTQVVGAPQLYEVGSPEEADAFVAWIGDGTPKTDPPFTQGECFEAPSDPAMMGSTGWTSGDWDDPSGDWDDPSDDGDTAGAPNPNCSPIPCAFIATASRWTGCGDADHDFMIGYTFQGCLDAPCPPNYDIAETHCGGDAEQRCDIICRAYGCGTGYSHYWRAQTQRCAEADDCKAPNHCFLLRGAAFECTCQGAVGSGTGSSAGTDGASSTSATSG